MLLQIISISFCRINCAPQVSSYFDLELRNTGQVTPIMSIEGGMKIRRVCEVLWSLRRGYDESKLRRAPVTSDSKYAE